MISQRKRPDRWGPVPGAYQAAFSALYSNPSDPIAEAISRGPGNYRLACPHCDKPRDTALSVTVEPGGSAVWYCHRCGFKGTTTKPSPRAIKAKGRREAAAAVWREGVRNALTGAQPKRWPPFTRDLKRAGEVYVFIGPEAWDCAKQARGRALVLPPGHPPDAYRWPVSGRVACLFQTTILDGITLSAGPYEDHAHGCPVCTGQLHLEFLRAFAALLLNSWAAVAVEAYGSFESVRFEPKVVRRAA